MGRGAHLFPNHREGKVRKILIELHIAAPDLLPGELRFIAQQPVDGHIKK